MTDARYKIDDKNVERALRTKIGNHELPITLDGTTSVPISTLLEDWRIPEDVRKDVSETIDFYTKMKVKLAKHGFVCAQDCQGEEIGNRINRGTMVDGKKMTWSDVEKLAEECAAIHPDFKRNAEEGRGIEHFTNVHGRIILWMQGNIERYLEHALSDLVYFHKDFFESLGDKKLTDYEAIDHVEGAADNAQIMISSEIDKALRERYDRAQQSGLAI